MGLQAEKPLRVGYRQVREAERNGAQRGPGGPLLRLRGFKECSPLLTHKDKRSILACRQGVDWTP